MASPQTHFLHISLLFLMISFFQPSLHQPLCHNVERIALMQFRDSFVIERHASAYPKVDLWESQGVDCCLWEGIWCDQNTGHVIGVDLSNSCLFGSLNSSSSLFHLVHLRHLNLAFNDFNYSEIPSALGNLSRLTYLNLSNSFFYGQVPFEISKLSKLAKLDLSSNFDVSHQGSLELRKPDLSSLIHNLTRLESLDLSFVNINSSIPSGLANVSSLTCLVLSQCGLFGTFPTVIFQQSKLEYLRVDGNWGLSGSLPEFHSSNPLKALFVNNTGFSGEFHESFGLLSSLEYLEAKNCNFSGFLPSSLSNLTMLYHLSLSNNSFKGSMAPFLSNLTQLVYLDLGFNQFTFREIPSLARSTHLKVLLLSVNQITGSFPYWVSNLTQLVLLNLGRNLLEGSLHFPDSFSKLQNLEGFSITLNRFSGALEFDTFLGLKNLKYLSLSGNSFSFLVKNVNNSMIPKFYYLGLGSCNLREFPDFLRYQHQLGGLDLSFNNIHGQIPEWLLKMSSKLWILNVSHNSLTSFEEPYNVIPSGLFFLDLSFNFLTGSLPVPQPSIIIYDVARNRFSGEIPPQFCNTTSLSVLGLSQNNLSGALPQCLGNQSKSLLILDLEDNNFHGPLPETWAAGIKLRVMKLGLNNFEGKLPRSLANCKALEYLDLSNNRIRDIFPSWLGDLPELKIVILRFNGFFGAINGPESVFLFPKLRIIDLSHNEFVGPLPLKYFKGWNAMANLAEKNATYLHAVYSFVMNLSIGSFEFPYSMTITNKGLKMEYAKILDVFIAIDLSSNKFEGEIPEVVGDLRGLQLLNLSNNMLAGPIPPALGYLSNLEALDLSHNKLAGRIPLELTQLNFLAVLNVSRNLLKGSIPQGKQFDTFDHSSFDGNIGLCGLPLSRKCDDDSESKASPPTSSNSEDYGDSSFLDGFGWKVVLLGFGCGFLGGAVIGTTLFNRKREWFMKKFRVGQGRMRIGVK